MTNGGLPAGLTIRPATAADLAVLKELWLAFDAWLLAIDGSDPADPQKFDDFAALAFGEAPLCQVLLAEADNEAVGYLVHHLGVWMDDVAPALFVADLFVKGTRHRQGIGRALMEQTRGIARERGAKHLFWTVWRENAAAQKFYLSLGAELFEEELFMRWPA